MGWIILSDEQQQRAVLYDTTSERPLPMSGFIGFEAREEAEDFIDFIDGDPRRLSAERLAEEYDKWHDEAHDDDGNFVCWEDRAAFGKGEEQ